MSVILVIQHRKHMHRSKLLSVASLYLPNVSTLSHKRHDFRVEASEYNTCVLIFSAIFV